MVARVIGASGEPVMAPRDWEHCSLCRLVRSSQEGRDRCSRSYARAGREAENLGDLYVFQCHAGLVCWAAPLVADETALGGGLLGSIVCGQVIMWEPDDYFVQDVSARTADLCIDRIRLAEAVGEIEHVSTVRVQAAAELLFAAASHVVQSNDLALRQRNEIYRQQRLLGEEIQERKRLEKACCTWGMYSPRRERDLMRAVRARQRSEAKRILNTMLADIFLTEPTRIDIIKARLLELAVFLARAAVEAGADPERILGLNYESVGLLSRCAVFEELCAWIVRVLDEFLTAVPDAADSTRGGRESETRAAVGTGHNRHNNTDAGCAHVSKGVIRECAAFMRRNFSNKLSVADVASYVCLSPSHLSHLFKQETGTSVMDYLTAMRIEEAKHLLTVAGCGIAEVAERTGFQDPAHFSRCFKRAEGLSPRDYRKRMISAG